MVSIVRYKQIITLSVRVFVISKQALGRASWNLAQDREMQSYYDVMKIGALEL